MVQAHSAYASLHEVLGDWNGGLGSNLAVHKGPSKLANGWTVRQSSTRKMSFLREEYEQ